VLGAAIAVHWGALVVICMVVGVVKKTVCIFNKVIQLLGFG